MLHPLCIALLHQQGRAYLDLRPLSNLLDCMFPWDPLQGLTSGNSKEMGWGGECLFQSPLHRSTLIVMESSGYKSQITGQPSPIMPLDEGCERMVTISSRLSIFNCGREIVRICIKPTMGMEGNESSSELLTLEMVTVTTEGQWFLKHVKVLQKSQGDNFTR